VATVFVLESALEDPLISEGLSVSPSWPTGGIGGIRLARLGDIVSYEVSSVYNSTHHNSRALNPIKDSSVRNGTSGNLSSIPDRFPDVTDRIRGRCWGLQGGGTEAILSCQRNMST